LEEPATFIFRGEEPSTLKMEVSGSSETLLPVQKRLLLPSFFGLKMEAADSSEIMVTVY
jgi:hypothetical protein